MADVWRAVIPKTILFDPDLTAESIRVYACLDIHCDKKGVCWPGISRLVLLSKTSRPTVIGAIKALEDKGYLIVQRQDRKKNIYKLPFHLFQTSKVALPVTSQTSKPGLPQTSKPALPEVNPSKLSKKDVEVIPPFDRERFFKDKAIRQKQLDEKAFEILGLDKIITQTNHDDDIKQAKRNFMRPRKTQ